MLLDRFASLETPANRNLFHALARHLAGSFADPCLPTYFNFALSCNERGREAADLIQRFVPLADKRVLDVGCAYGGFLVALAERGADPVGFDIDESLLRLAQSNFADFGRSFPVRIADVTRSADVAAYRRDFDVVICNDVIEHVSDPAIAVRHIAGMMRDDGLAYFEIPNPDYVRFVVADGHYQLFGITQLDPTDARMYFGAHAPGVSYSVGHYLRLAQYDAIFQQAGLTMHVLADPPTAADVDVIRWLVNDLQASLQTRLETVPEAARRAVELAVGAYLSHATSAEDDAMSAPDRFISRYGTAFWRVLGRKRPGPLRRLAGRLKSVMER